MAKNKYLDQRLMPNGKTSNLSLTNKFNLKKYIQQVAGSISGVSVTYSELDDLASNNLLTPNSVYTISDFRTCYDQPDYDYNGNAISGAFTYLQGPVQPLTVRAATTSTLDPYAFQADYPNDIVKYDPTFTTTEITNGVAFGRITERIDSEGNRTDYDHRVIKFKRYRFIKPNSLQQGFIDIGLGGIVTGTGTDFTLLSVGDIIYVPQSFEKYFTITNIGGPGNMTITGYSIPILVSTIFYSCYVTGYESYKQNNVDLPIDYQEFTTFDTGGYVTLSDNASNYGGIWNNGDNQGSGFSSWSIVSGSNSGIFLGNPANDGMEISGIGTQSFAAYATGSGYTNMNRPLGAPMEIADTLSFWWAMNFDANTGNKGFDIKAGGSTVFNINNGNSGTITSSNGIADAGYGTTAMRVIITRTNANTYSFRMSSRSGNPDYVTTFTSNTPVDAIEFYIGGQNDGAGQRNIYFNNFSVTIAAPAEINAINNYIGDYSTYFINEGIGNFLLANNVFQNGQYYNNIFGNGCYNNTFNDDCTNNKIGDYFTNNITDDDFDNNIIGNYFEFNIISSNFNDNQIGNDFNQNQLFDGSFYRNRIGNNFQNNFFGIGQDFQNNVIGNQFNNNAIFDSTFIKNNIGNGYNNNLIFAQFESNKISNGFNNNYIYNTFYENVCLDYFEDNVFGNFSAIGGYTFSNNQIGNYFNKNLVIGNFGNNSIKNIFYNNQIGYNFTNNTIQNNFENNTITDNFSYNTIGNTFQNNNILEGFGFGGFAERGNVIGNAFRNNNIGEYFYDNTIGDQFIANTIGNDFGNNIISMGFQNNLIGTNFQNNDVKFRSLVGVDFRTFQGNVVTFTNNTPNGADNVYINLSPNSSTSIFGVGSGFDVTVAGGIVTSVAIFAPGFGYQPGDVLTILGSQFGGVNGVDDLIITVSTVSEPFVNKQTNCVINLDEFSNQNLYYIDNAGLLISVPITA